MKIAALSRGVLVGTIGLVVSGSGCESKFRAGGETEVEMPGDTAGAAGESGPSSSVGGSSTGGGDGTGGGGGNGTGGGGGVGTGGGGGNGTGGGGGNGTGGGGGNGTGGTRACIGFVEHLFDQNLMTQTFVLEIPPHAHQDLLVVSASAQPSFDIPFQWEEVQSANPAHRAARRISDGTVSEAEFIAQGTGQFSGYSAVFRGADPYQPQIDESSHILASEGESIEAGAINIVPCGAVWTELFLEFTQPTDIAPSAGFILADVQSTGSHTRALAYLITEERSGSITPGWTWSSPGIGRMIVASFQPTQ